MDKFDLSGIATQNSHKNVKFNPKLVVYYAYFVHLVIYLIVKTVQIFIVIVSLQSNRYN
jgi:hypothetical protein